MPKKYLAATGFTYPVHKKDRDALRKDPLGVFGEETHDVSPGEYVDPPADLLKDWLKRGIIIEEDDNGSAK